MVDILDVGMLSWAETRGFTLAQDSRRHGRLGAQRLLSTMPEYNNVSSPSVRQSVGKARWQAVIENKCWPTVLRKDMPYQ